MHGVRSNLLYCGEMTTPAFKSMPLPSVNDRWISALAHASILLPAVGIFVPVVLWAKREQYSQYARIQTLQALLYQLLQWVWIQIITLIIITGLFIFTFITAGSNLTPEVYSNRMLTASLAFSTAIAIGWGAYQIVGLIGGVICMTGRNFEYPILGRWMIQFISNSEFNPAFDNPQKDHLDDDSSSENDATIFREEMLISAVSHGSILIPVIGLIVPVLLYLMNKHLFTLNNRYQVLQALVFQAFGQAANVVILTMQIFITIGMVILVLLIESSIQAGSSEILILTIGLLAILFMVITIISLLLFPLLATFGIVASVQVLRGRQYQYPILGKWLFHMMNKREISREWMKAVKLG
jgi:uncharacterized Tic20 family protein